MRHIDGLIVITCGFQGAMNFNEIQECEVICKDMVDKKMPVFASESGLAAAKNIQGLRAVFEEVFSKRDVFYC